MFIFYQTTFEAPAHYLDKVTGDKWRRIAGGIGWPQSGKEGVGLVLAETLEEPYAYKILISVQDHNALGLLETCKALEGEYPVKGWHGNAFDKAMMLLLYEFTKGKQFGDKLIFLGSPLAGENNNSGYYLPKVIELGKADRLNAAASLAVLRELEADDQWPETHLNQNIADFPALAALCYPLAYMQIYSGKVVKPMKPDYKDYGGMAWQL